MDCSRRAFLRNVSTGIPTVTLILRETEALATALIEEPTSGKFTPVALGQFFNASSIDFGPRERAMPLSATGPPDGLIRTPGGRQNFRGIPFWLGQEGVQNKSWVVLSRRPSPSATGSVLIPLEGRASFICLAQFCDWDESEIPPPAEDVVERVGQPLAEVVLVYEDGSERALPIRRRFEVNSPSIFWGHLCFAALPHLKDAPRKLNEPLPDGPQWGGLQTSVRDNAYSSNGPDGRLVPLVWVCALANPEPERFLKALRLQATADDSLIVCGLTLYHGPRIRYATTD